MTNACTFTWMNACVSAHIISGLTMTLLEAASSPYALVCSPLFHLQQILFHLRHAQRILRAPPKHMLPDSIRPSSDLAVLCVAARLCQRA